MRIVCLALIFAACSPYDPNLGPTPFLCGSGTPQCPEGYTCQSENMKMVCVENGAKTADAGNPNGMCADDSMIETATRNDTIATAYPTPVAVSTCSIPYSGLAICPSGDKDYYSVQLTQTQTLTAQMTYETWGGKLAVTIVNGGGINIAPSMPVSGMDNTYSATAVNLNAGLWYVLVQTDPSVTSGEQRNNYKLTITASSPCP